MVPQGAHRQVREPLCVGNKVLCEKDGKARLKLKADEWSAATQASNKNPDDVELKARSTELFKQLQTSSQAVRDGCGYEGVHKTLQARISRLHPKMSDAEAFWFARWRTVSGRLRSRLDLHWGH